MLQHVPQAKFCALHVAKVAPEGRLWLAVLPLAFYTIVLDTVALPTTGWIVAAIRARWTPEQARVEMVPRFIPVHKRLRAANAKPMHAPVGRKLHLPAISVAYCALFAGGTISERETATLEAKHVAINAVPTLHCDKVLGEPLGSAHFTVWTPVAMAFRPIVRLRGFWTVRLAKAAHHGAVDSGHRWQGGVVLWHKITDGSDLWCWGFSPTTGVWLPAV
mgnify:CR=1 FL=1